MLRSAKDGLKLKIQGVYWIQCECEKVYVGQSRKTVEKRCKEYQRYIRLHQTEVSSGKTVRSARVIAWISLAPPYYTEHQDTWIDL